MTFSRNFLVILATSAVYFATLTGTANAADGCFPLGKFLQEQKDKSTFVRVDNFDLVGLDAVSPEIRELLLSDFLNGKSNEPQMTAAFLNSFGEITQFSCDTFTFKSMTWRIVRTGSDKELKLVSPKANQDSIVFKRVGPNQLQFETHYSFTDANQDQVTPYQETKLLTFGPGPDIAKPALSKHLVALQKQNSRVDKPQPSKSGPQASNDQVKTEAAI